MDRIIRGLRGVACSARAVILDYVGWAFGYEGAAPLRRAAGSGEATDGWTHPEQDTRTSSTGRPGSEPGDRSRPTRP